MFDSFDDVISVRVYLLAWSRDIKPASPGTAAKRYHFDVIFVINSLEISVAFVSMACFTKLY